MIDDHQVRSVDGLPGPTIKASIRTASLARANRRIRVHRIPDGFPWGRREFLPNSFPRLRIGPLCNPYSSSLCPRTIRFGRPLSFASEWSKDNSPDRPTRRLEVCPLGQVRNLLEQFPQSRNVLAEQLFLQANRIGCHHARPLPLLGKQNRRNQVSQTFSHPGTRLEKQMFAANQGSANRSGHLGLFPPMIEIQDFLQPSP